MAAVDLFPDRQHVWLRSRERGTYLHAHEDGDGVFLSRGRASMNAAWTVHRVWHGNDLYVLLHSAAYGRYLSATVASAPPFCRGRRVELRNYEELEDEAIRWQPVWFGEGDILLRHVAAGFFGYLRANGKYQPWINGVSVGHYLKFSTMMQWVVEPIPSREFVPLLPPPTRLHRFGSLTVLLPSRVIQFIGNCEGCYSNNVSFTFRGRSVFRLRTELVRRLGIRMDVLNNLVMYVRAGTLRAVYPTRRRPTQQ